MLCYNKLGYWIISFKTIFKTIFPYFMILNSNMASVYFSHLIYIIFHIALVEYRVTPLGYKLYNSTSYSVHCTL